jgi:ubiquinone/menaquinone biosynthesis C-methylase UbiE
MNPEIRSDDPNQTLADLIKRGLDRTGWSADTAAAEAKRRGLGKGLGPRNIRNYRNGLGKRKPTETIVRRFAILFGESEDSWLRHFPDYRLGPLLLDKDAVIRDQAQLGEGDEVCLISSRAFLEADDSDVVEIVLKNLDRGIVYKYYFPSGDANPYGDAAAVSYRRFREQNVGRYWFSKPPLLFGYAVKPTVFRYFSGLHTIVRFTSRTPGVGKTYVYIELARGGTGRLEQAWYLLPDVTARQITLNLNEARSSLADAELPVLPLNSCLNRVRTDYIKWFQRDESVARYSSLRPVLGHSGDRCLRALKIEIARLPHDGKGLRYLDIGCGDGEITRSVANYVAEHSDAEVTTVGLDSSSAQLRSAAAAFNDQERIKFETHAGKFETYQAGASFNLVTAIHSLYTIDEAYVRRIYELLELGGIAFIWMAMRKNNVVTAVSDALDAKLRPGQRRNAADDVARYASGVGLSPKLVPSEGVISSVLDKSGTPTNAGCDLIDFCALQPVKKGTEEWGAAIGALRSLHQNGNHALTDGLVIIQRNR